MKNIIMLLALIFTTNSFADGFANWYANCGQRPNSFCNVLVKRVYDGDTFYVNVYRVHSLFGDDLGVRVKGVDTPELKGGTPETKAEGIKARDFTIAFLNKTKKVDLRNCIKGQFFRIICDVYSHNKSLGDALTKAGLAKVYAK